MRRPDDVLLGIDLGTSNLKCVALSQTGVISELASVPIVSTREGRVHEQDPDTWWLALQTACTLAARGGFDLRRVAAIGLTGHMHGTVFVDREGAVVRPCMTWADTRTVEETRELRQNHGRQFSRITLNEVDVAFTAPKLLWIARNDPDSLARARWIVSAKDFLRAKLTGSWGTDRTDAAGTLVLDVATDEWSPELLDLVGVDRSVMPPVAGSADVVGAVTAGAAATTGLPAGVPVVAGSGDIASATLGAGMVQPGQVYINVGTAAQVLSIHEGLSAPNRYWLADVSPERSIHSSTVFGAGLAHSEIARKLDASRTATPSERFAALDAAAAGVEFGCDGLVFVPSLGAVDGERDGRSGGGDFHGVAPSPIHQYRAVLEGVALGIQSLMPRGTVGVSVGGGIRKSRLWLEILSTVLETEIRVIDHDASPVGAAMLAGVGVGWFETFTDAARGCSDAGRVVTPTPVAGLEEMKGRFADLARGGGDPG